MHASPNTVPPGETVGDRVRRLRKSRGWDQAELGEQVGVDRPSVSNWERGVFTPSGENLIRLAGVFGVTTDYLLYGEGGLYRQAYEEIAAVVDRVRGALDDLVGAAAGDL